MYIRIVQCGSINPYTYVKSEWRMPLFSFSLLSCILSTLCAT